jgi:hypothetical protein
MVIDFRKKGRKWVAELWNPSAPETFPETIYQEINIWCIATFNYHARTAYNVFEFKKEQDLTLFVLKWSD